jgi:hypothetical protein
MNIPPAVMVHGLSDIEAAIETALALARPVTLLSAPAAGVYAGCLWWRALIDTVQTDTPFIDILDCADASGLALGALRCGVSRLILSAEAPGWAAVAALASQQGGFVLPQAPQALDLSVRSARRRLPDWLNGS